MQMFFMIQRNLKKCYRQKMVSILTKYSPYYEKDMEDYDTEGEEDDAKEDKKKSGLEIFEDAWYYVICTDNGMEGTIVI